MAHGSIIQASTVPGQLGLGLCFPIEEQELEHDGVKDGLAMVWHRWGGNSGGDGPAVHECRRGFELIICLFLQNCSSRPVLYIKSLPEKKEAEHQLNEK